VTGSSKTALGVVEVGFYADRIVPRIVEASLGNTEAAGYRTRATAGLAGTVVEIGFGSGLNIDHYPPEVERVLAVEPAPGARARAQARIEASPVPVELVGLDGQKLPLDDGVADAVLSTWTLCTIPDLRRALGEVRRVLKPEGRFHFLEHGLHPDARVAAWQRRLDPIQRCVFAGCHLSRAIDRHVVDSGFELEHLDHDQMSGPRPFGYLYLGTAIPDRS
jgi:ubiquinone/menaquinone biosynthesis C-methylase UbiE